MRFLIGGQDIPGLVVWAGFDEPRRYGRRLIARMGIGPGALHCQIRIPTQRETGSLPQQFGAGHDRRPISASRDNGGTDLENDKGSQDEGEE